MRFPYTTFRRGQRESIDRISRRLGGIVVLKAPTGFGKTIVAIVSHSSANRVLYVVRTINEMAPVIKELKRVGEPFTFIFSGARMCPLLNGGGTPDEDFWINCKVIRSKGLCPYYNRLVNVTDKEVEELITSSGIDPKGIVRNMVMKLSVCPFFALTRLIRRSKFVIATYPYLFRDEVFRTAFTDDLSNYYVIIDEAHTILNPQNIYEEELNEDEVSQALKEAHKYELGHEIISYLKRLKEVVSSVRYRMLRRIGKEVIYPGAGLTQLLEDALIDVRIKLLKEYLTDASRIIRVSTKLTKIVKFLKLLENEDFEVYGVADQGLKKLKILPLSFEPIRERLRLSKGVLLMSGTMPSQEIIKSILNQVTEYIDVEEDYGRVFPRHNVFYAVYTAVTSSYYYRTEAMFSKYAELLYKLYETLTNGLILAVYPSYQFMNKVLSKLPEDMNEFIEDPYTSFNELVDTVLKYDKVVIHAVAGGKVAEGIELVSPSKGKSLINTVVIMGVPYPQPDDYVRDAKRRLIREVGRSLSEMLVMELPAAIKVLQAVGRAVRSESDRAFIVLADRRFLNHNLRSLLNIKFDLVTSNVNEVLLNYSKFTKGLL